MKLWQYLKVRELIIRGFPDNEIIEQSQLTSTEVTAIRNGAKLPDIILLQDSDVFERCPECGATTQVPCYACFLKNLSPDIKTVEVISRPAKNRNRQINVSLDIDLLDGEDDDDDF